MQREQFAAPTCRVSTCMVYQPFSFSALSDEKGAYSKSDHSVAKAALEDI